MFDYIPGWGKTLAITIFLTLITGLISGGVEFSIIQQPEIQIFVYEEKDYASNESKIKTIIQNIGNKQEENLELKFLSPFSYSLNSYNSTDSNPKVQSNLDSLDITIERLAPESFVEIDVHGTFNINSSKSIILSTNSKTEFLILNNTVSDIGITNVNYQEKIDTPLIIEGLVGGMIFVIFRTFSFNRYEFMRRKYLGSYNFPIKRNSSNFYLIGLVALLVVGVFAANHDSSIFLPIKYFPSPYIDYELNELNSELFLEFKDPDIWYPATEGNLILGAAIFFLILFSKYKIMLPTTIWLKPLSHDKITLSQISGSYIPSQVVTKNTRSKILKDNIEVYVVKEKEKIIGLISQKEVSKLDILKSKLGSMLQNDKLSSPKWDKSKGVRENFTIVYDYETLDVIKTKLDDHGKEFAIVFDSNKKFKGVIEYDTLFDKKSSKKNNEK